MSIDDLVASTSSTTAPPPNPATGAGSEQEPTTALHLLKSFKECQERRVAHWAEYNDAFTTYLSQPPAGASHEDVDVSPQRLEANEGNDDDAAGGGAARTPHSCSHAAHDALATTGSDGRIAITDAMLQEILHLVTQGLLECSHRARAIQTELALPHIGQPRLANLVGRIQERENALLRATVEKDQLRKLAQAQGREYGDKVDELQRSIAQLRAQIAEDMQEVMAEMAEL